VPRPGMTGSTARSGAVAVRPLRRALRPVDDWLFAPAPAERLAAVRILVGLYAAIWSAVRLPAHLAHVDQAPSRWDPVGMLAPFGAPLPTAVVVALAVATPVLALAFAAGWWWRIVGPLTAVALTGVTTLDSSWGLILHTENLLVLHVIVLAAAPGAADAWVWRPAMAPDCSERATGAGARYGWPLRVAVLVVVLAYVLAGLAKVRGAGFGWGTGETLRNLVAHDNLRKAVLGDAWSPVGAAMVGHAWLFTPFAVATLVVELGAVVVLAGRRWRTVWTVAAWLFHVGVLAVMAILFPYQLSGVAFAPMFRVERLAPLRWFAARYLGPPSR
jgi:hypothetical protein